MGERVVERVTCDFLSNGCVCFRWGRECSGFREANDFDFSCHWLQFNVCVVACAVRVFGVGHSCTFTVSVSFHRSHVTCSFLNNGADAESGNDHRKQTHGRAYRGVALAVCILV